MPALAPIPPSRGRVDLNPIDHGAREFVQRIASPGLTTAMRLITFFGEGLVLAVAVTLLAILFLLAERKHAALLLAVAMAGAGLLDNLLKHLFHRPRPAPFFGTPLPGSYSFPSGHALTSCCFFVVMAVLLAEREQRHHVRIAIWLGAAMLAAAIGLSRIYLGVHYATDVIAGYTFALIWLYVVVRIFRRYVRHF